MSRRLKIAFAAAGFAAVAVLAWLGPRQRLEAAEAPAAQPGTPAAFALADCRARLLDGAPAIAVAFTQPLAPRQDWSRLVRAFQGDAPERDDRGKPILAEDAARKATTPLAARWVLGDNPRVLHLPFAKPGKLHRIEIDAALKAAGGATLAQATNCSAVGEEMPPTFHFASRGTVLPAGLNGGLPVVTINTPEVDVQFLRIEDAELPTFLEHVAGTRRAKARGNDDEDGAAAEPDDARAVESEDELFDWDRSYDYDVGEGERRLKGRLSGWHLEQQLRNRARSVYITRFATDRRPDRRNVSHLPVEQIPALQQPGVYVAVMTAPGRFSWDYQVTYFYVTDIGLHLRRHAAQTDVFATSLKTGEALAGVPVSMLDGAGKALAQATTDGQGRAVFAGAKLATARVAMARRGRELSVIALREPALDLSEHDLGGRPAAAHKLFVWAGRDLYRPGERFTVNVLARDGDGRPLPAAAPAAAAVAPRPAASAAPAGAPAAAAQAAAAAPTVTLTLKKPDGSPAQTRLVRPSPAGVGYYQHTIELPADAPTGRWWLEARTDPASRRADTRWPLQVEEFLPERMKLELAAPPATLTGPDAALDIAVSASYLYGAPAAGNRLLASVGVATDRVALPESWPGFLFGDLADDTARQRQDLEETELDADGRAVVRVPGDTAGRASPMTLRATFSLLESNGRPVVRSIERRWWPAPVLVGVRPVFERNVTREDALAEFELTRVDTAGRFVPAKALELRLVREERRWYWRHDERGWHSGYDVHEEVVEDRTLALPRRTMIALPTPYGTFRLEVKDPQTGQTLKYRFFAGWGAQDADEIGNRPDRVKLQFTGAPYRSGGTARLTILPPHDGEALVTVEGDRVLWSRRVAVRVAGTPVDIPIAEGWNRHDLHVGVVAFRPASRGDRVTPSRAVGIAHLPLAREDRRLKLEIAAPARAAPDQTTPVKLRVLDAAGQPLAGRDAVVTLSAVDVGILAITNFATPDPFDAFFGRQRYEADLLDLYGKLIERMDGNAAKLRFGGDTAPRDTQSLPRKVKLVDLFTGPVRLDANGEATVPLALPDFNGRLRLMAVAATADRYGSAQAETTVSAPIVAELAMPRFLAPGDVATIALDVTNLSGSARTVAVALQAGAPVVVRGQPAPVKLADGQKTVLRFSAEANDAHGLAPLKLTVKAGDIQFVREAALQVQPTTPAVTRKERLRLDPGQSAKLDADAVADLWPGGAGATLTLSSSATIDVRDAVQGLLTYPYGCAEQTTSTAYPLVYIDAQGARAYGMKPLSREERAKRLDVAFGRLAGMQGSGGGFGFWSGTGEQNPWLSAYVAGFLNEAKAQGFAVPETMQARATTWLLEQFQRAPGAQGTLPAAPRRDAQGRLVDANDIDATRDAHARFATAAHLGYTLALDRKAPLATLRTLHDRFREHAHSPLPLVHLAVALRLMGDGPRAQQAVDDALRRPYGIATATGSRHDAAFHGDDYGSPIRDLAASYALLRRHGFDDPRQETLLVDLDRQLPRRLYLSTQERLALFLAARAAAVTPQKNWSARLAGARTDALTAQAPLATAIDPQALARGVTLANTGSQTLFAELAVGGFPKKPPPEQSSGIRVERSWWTVQGRPVDTRELKTGELLIVRLRVGSVRNIPDALVVDRIPAGFEVENLNLVQGAGAGSFSVQGESVADAMSSPWIRHTEFRDDRFVAAVNVAPRGDRYLYYLVRVVTPGRYVVPATFAESMYDPETRGVGAAQPGITVVDPKPR